MNNNREIAIVEKVKKQDYFCQPSIVSHLPLAYISATHNS